MSELKKLSIKLPPPGARSFTTHGQVVVTRSLSDMIAESEAFSQHVVDCMRRYTACDWGDIGLEDWQQNDDAINPDNTQERVVAVYKNEAWPTVWIITEWDRSYTTILQPSEY